MRVGLATIDVLTALVTGDALGHAEHGIAPYKTHAQLDEFFRHCSAPDDAPGSRPVKTRDVLSRINGTPTMKTLIIEALDPRRFNGFEYGSASEAAAKVNEYLSHDGFLVVHRSGGRVAIEAAAKPAGGSGEELRSMAEADVYIRDQLHTCNARLADNDYDGVVTAARALVEAVLVAVEREVDGDSQPYGGDLLKLWKRVGGLLGFDAKDDTLPESLKKILRGLSGIIAGLAEARNQMGDAHVPSYRAREHHARLAVNTAHALVDFTVSSYKYQRDRGRLASVGKS